MALNSVAGIGSDMRSTLTGHRYLVKKYPGLRPAGRERDSLRHACDGDGAPLPRCPPRQNTRFARRRTLAHKNQSKPPRSAPSRCRPTQHPSARKGFSARVLFVSSRYWPDLQTSSASAGERDQRSPFQVGILGTCWSGCSRSTTSTSRPLASFASQTSVGLRLPLASLSAAKVVLRYRERDAAHDSRVL